MTIKSNRGNVTNLCLFLAACLLSGCTGMYLHDDGYAQQATDTHGGFMKIDLNQKFTDQMNHLTAFESVEDKAVAGYATANRDRVLQQVIGLPDWADPKSKSGGPSLGEIIKDDLTRVNGSTIISGTNEKALRKTLGTIEWNSFQLSNAQIALKNNIQAFNALKKDTDKRTASCPEDAPQTSPPALSRTADDYYQEIQYW